MLPCVLNTAYFAGADTVELESLHLLGPHPFGVLHTHPPPWCHGLDHIPLFLSAHPMWTLPLGAEVLGMYVQGTNYQSIRDAVGVAVHGGRTWAVASCESLSAVMDSAWVDCMGWKHLWSSLGLLCRCPLWEHLAGQARFFELWLDEALREISPALGNGLPFVSSDKIKRLSISNTSNVEGFLFLRRNMIWGRKVGWVVTLLIDFMWC